MGYKSLCVCEAKITRAQRSNCDIEKTMQHHSWRSSLLFCESCNNEDNSSTDIVPIHDIHTYIFCMTKIIISTSWSNKMNGLASKQTKFSGRVEATWMVNLMASHCPYLFTAHRPSYYWYGRTFYWVYCRGGQHLLLRLWFILETSFVRTHSSGWARRNWILLQELWRSVTFLPSTYSLVKNIFGQTTIVENKDISDNNNHMMLPSIVISFEISGGNHLLQIL